MVNGENSQRCQQPSSPACHPYRRRFNFGGNGLCSRLVCYSPSRLVEREQMLCKQCLSLFTEAVQWFKRADTFPVFQTYSRGARFGLARRQSLVEASNCLVLIVS